MLCNRYGKRHHVTFSGDLTDVPLDNVGDAKTVIAAPLRACFWTRRRRRETVLGHVGAITGRLSATNVQD